MPRIEPAIAVAGAAALLLLAGAAWFVWAAIDPVRARGVDELNAWCPVLTDEPASDEWQLVHGGRVIAFCCNACRETFRSDPGAYLDAIVAGERSPRALALRAAEWAHESPRTSIWLAAVAVVFAAARLLRGRLGERPRAERARALAAHPVALLVAAQAGVIAHLLAPPPPPDPTAPVAGRDTFIESHARLQLARHAAAQGRAPQPENPLDRVFYRGNDERDDALGFGGRYRTAELRVSLVLEDGAVVAPGTCLMAHQPALRLEIVRSAFTTERLFAPRLMSRVRLTRKWDAEPDDAVPLTTLEPGRRWEAVYPLRHEVLTLKHATVFVRLERAVHYAILLDVTADAAGVVDPLSNIVVAPVLTLGAVPREEWLSLAPIPELTEPNTTDERLLGVGAYDRVGR